MADPRIGVIVVAAGVGSRFGAAMPKAFVRLSGRSLLAWSVEAALGCPGVACVIVVAPPGHVPRPNGRPTGMRRCRFAWFPAAPSGPTRWRRGWLPFRTTSTWCSSTTPLAR